MIKPKPTRWHNINFRSRLEAHWAIFFDALGLEFQYEPQRYRFDGFNYLPDFFLPKIPCFIEIKSDGTLRQNTPRLIEGLARHTGLPSLLITGNPQPGAYSVRPFPVNDLSDVFEWNAIVECRSCAGFCLIEIGDERGNPANIAEMQLGKHTCDGWGALAHLPLTLDTFAGAAYRAALNTKFDRS